MFRKGLIQSHSSLLNFLFQLFDAALVVFCFFIAAYLNDFPWNPHFTTLAIISVGLYNLFAKRNNLYLSWRTASIWTEMIIVIKAWVFVMLIVLALALFMSLTDAYFRRVFIAWLVFGLTILSLWRACLRIVLRQLRKQGKNRRSLAIAGAGKLGIRVAGSILNNPWTGLDVGGIYDDYKPKGSLIMPGIGLHISGDLDDLVKAAEAGRFDCVYIALPLKAEKTINHLVNKLSETTASVYIVPVLLMHVFL